MDGSRDGSETASDDYQQTEETVEPSNRVDGPAPPDGSGTQATGGSVDDSEDEDDNKLTRRSLLAAGLLLGGGAGAYLLTRGGDDEKAVPDNSTQDEQEATKTPSTDPTRVFTIWEQLRQALRESPDNVRGTAETLVEEGDPKQLFEFVRDTVALQPPTQASNAGFMTATHGGPRGAIRTGMATPREKAELLADLLQRAGYEATVKRYNRGIDPSRARELYLTSTEQPFDPGVDTQQLAEWQTELGVSDERSESPKAIDPDGEDSAALAERVLAALPAVPGAKQARMFAAASDSLGAVPVVAFRKNEADSTSGSSQTTGTPGESGSVRYADLFHADETFGTLTEPGKVGRADAPEAGEVSVTLEAASADAPGSPSTLVSRTWRTDQLAGRQLLVDFLPGVSPFDHPGVEFDHITRFIPTLTVQDPHAEKDVLEGLSVMGNAITPGGDRVTVAPDGTVRRNGRVVSEGNKPFEEFSLSPRATYLRTSGDPDAKDAKPIPLADANVEPGDRVTIEPVGNYQNGSSDVLAVFSGSSRLLDSTRRHRVPDAIDVGADYRTLDTYNGKRTTDIPEDFQVAGKNQSSRTVTVPEGATHLFVSTADNFFGDNVDDDGDYGVRIYREGETQAKLSQDPPEAVNRVRELTAEASVGGFPQVELEVTARDAEGNKVEGLPGRAFSVTEDGQAVNAEVTANTSAPRVKMIFDSSLSMIISGFYEDDNRSRFRNRIERTLKDINPEAVVEFEEVGSNAWKHLAEAAVDDANLIIYISDGDGYNSKGKTPERVTAIKEGPPAIMLSVNDVVHDAQQEMADLSGGTAIGTNSEQKTRKAVKQYAKQLVPTLASYTFRYRSPTPEGSGKRTVRVRLDGSDVSAETSYTVPEASLDPRSKRGLVGLYLTVDVDGSTSRRTLAGYDPAVHDRDPTEADRKAVQETLHASHALHFESGGASPTVHFEDVIAGRQTLKPMVTALERQSVEDVRAVVNERGLKTLWPYTKHFHPKLPDRITDDTLTYSTGLRTVLFSQWPLPDESKSRQSVDVLDTARYDTLTADEDPQRAVRLTAERTARKAIVERELMETTTASLLADAELVPASDAVSEWDAETRTLYRVATNRRPLGRGAPNRNVVARSGETAAFFSVDPASGQLSAVLPDGSGGGDVIYTTTPTVKKMAAWWNTIQTGPATGTAMGMVIQYNILLSKLYGIATVSVDTMGVTGGAAKALQTFVCNAAKNLFLGIPGTPPIGFVNNLATLTDTTSPFSTCGG